MASSKRCAGLRPRALCSRPRSTGGCDARLTIGLLLCGLWRDRHLWRMYALFFPRVSLHNTGTQSYLRSLHYPFTRARCRVRRSAWLLGSSTKRGRTTQKPALRASSSAQGHTRRSLCASGATMRAGACILRHVPWRVAPRRLHRHEPAHEGLNNPRPQVRTLFPPASFPPCVR